MTIIYVLCEPDGKTIRYVGKTKYPKQRYSQHLGDAKFTASEKMRWLRSLRLVDKYPTMRKIDQTSDAKAGALEMSWLCYLVRAGCDMTNGPYPEKYCTDDYPFVEKLADAMALPPLVTAEDIEAKMPIPFEIASGFRGLAETVRLLASDAGLEVNVHAADIVNLVLSSYLRDVDKKLVRALTEEFCVIPPKLRHGDDFERRLNNIERWYHR